MTMKGCFPNGRFWVVFGISIGQSWAFVAAPRWRLVTTHVPFHVGDRRIYGATLPKAEKESVPPKVTTTKEEAIASLSILLKRQAEELEETMRLLDRLKSTSAVEELEKDREFVTSTKTLSAAASLLTGVDYGFKSRSDGPSFSELKTKSTAFENYGPPANVWELGTKQFWRNLNAMRGEYEDEADVTLTPKQIELQAQLEKLTLNATEIWRRELALGPIEAPLLIKIPYFALCYLLDVVFEGRYVPSRFFLLETVARMPYFSYISMIHIYETLGFWRRSADVKRIHFAEELNEFRHLLIMESLGGDQSWWVRFLAQHSAITYFIALCILWLISPSLSYTFSELLETHAVNTYGTFLDENEELLKKLPPSVEAVEYYCFESSDPFYSEFQTSALAEGRAIRRPGENMKSLYDVFSAIRADEGDHVSAMKACLDPDTPLRSASIEKKVLFGLGLTAVGYLLLSTGGGELIDVGEGLSGDTISTDAINDAMGALGLGNLLDQIASESKGGEAEALAAEIDAIELRSFPEVMEKVGEVAAWLARNLAKFLQFL